MKIKIMLLILVSVMLTSCAQVDTVDTTKNVEVTLPAKKSKTFTVTMDDLYPDPKTQKSLGYMGFTEPISGVIKAANFYHGSLEVQGDDGDYYALSIHPDDLSTYLKSDLRYFMKPGNRISTVCTVEGARVLQIVNATFTEQ